MSIDQIIDGAIRPVADAISSFIFYSVEVGSAGLPLIVVWLVAGGIFFTVYLRFINIRGFRHAIRIVRGKYKEPGEPGEISQFQALTTAISGTVGLGNIAGVAIAISLGGPGATFWLILAGFLGMTTKFAECTLGVLYRRENPDGSVSGGPMYYLERGLADLNLPLVGKALGVFYAIAVVIGCLGIGNMFQSNQATAILIDVTGAENSILDGNAWIVGLIFAIAVGAVIIGGIKSIALTTVRLVPFMAILYMLSAIVILSINVDEIPQAFIAIWDGAFAPEGIAGGIIGVLVQGFRRATFSNEAGLGSSAIAHSSARTLYPVSEGFVALLEPFIDTIVICTMTALVIITTVYDPSLASAGVTGVELTTRAFESTLSWSPIPLAIATMLFAFSTMIAWSYYGLKAFTYLTGEGKWQDNSFKIVFCIFVAIGASINISALVDLADALVFLVAIPNLIGLYIMAPIIKRELNNYDFRR